MAIKIEMPKLSDTMEEGVLSKWNIKEGDTVSSGDIIADVETDKATMEMEAFDSGTVLKLLVKEGETIPLGGVVAIIGEPGEDISALLAASGSAGAVESPASESSTNEAPEKAKEASFDPIFGGIEDGAKEKSASATTSNGRVKASPLAKKLAEDKGLDLTTISGSGPEGRIVKADVERAGSGVASPAVAATSGATKTAGKAAPSGSIPVSTAQDQTLAVSQMRKTIARRLSESKFSNPHFYVTVDIDMDQAVAARTKLNEVSEVKISFNDIVVKAAALALKKHPWVNASWLDTQIQLHGQVHVAFAVAVEEGLLTPVIRNTDLKPLATISQESRELAGLARDRKLQPDQMEGSTFTISNLGMFGVEDFTAIINPPNAAILAVGGIRDETVVKNGQIVPGKRMKVTLSSDHRVVDGAKAAEFLNTLKQMLENPLAMLL